MQQPHSLTLEVLPQIIAEEEYLIFKSDKIQKLLPHYILTEEFNQFRGEFATKEKNEEYREKFRKFKNETPAMYQKYRKSMALMTLISESISDLSLDQRKQFMLNIKIYVIATYRIEIGGKNCAMTHYITWMYQKDAISTLLKQSIVVIMHQDEFLIEYTQQEISKIFQKAVLWDREKQSLQDLKDTMALFVHMKTHNMVDIRGNAAETEWMEAQIYGALAIPFDIDRKKIMMDLESLAHPFYSKFKAIYDRSVKL